MPSGSSLSKRMICFRQQIDIPNSPSMENGIDADGMDYSKLTPLLVEAVKELKQIVDDQQKRIEYLESN